MYVYLKLMNSATTIPALQARLKTDDLCIVHNVCKYLFAIIPLPISTTI